MIKVYDVTEIGHIRLVDYAKHINLLCRDKNLQAVCHVENIFFDFGSGLMWTTIVCNYVSKKRNGVSSSYQILNPIQHRIIVDGDYDKIEEVTDHVMKYIAEFCE